MSQTDGNEKVTFTVELTDAQAWEFAQFLKRVGIDDYKRLATGDTEAWAMMDAGEIIRAALSRCGYAPR